MEELLDAYVRYLVAEKNLSPLTLRNYRSDLTHFARYLEDEEDVPVLEADRAMARRYLGTLKEGGMATASLTRKVSTIRSFYRFLVREGKIESTTLTSIIAPKREHRLPTILSKDDLDALIESADETTPSGLRNRAMLELMYASGVRLSEVVGLNLRSIDLDERTVVVRGKGNKERMVLVGEPAERTLRRYLSAGRPKVATGAEEALFLNRDGNRLSGRSVQKMVRLVRDAPFGRRRGAARGAGAAGPRQRPDDADLHARDRGPPARDDGAGAREAGRDLAEEA